MDTEPIGTLDMRIYPQQLTRHLSTALAPCYLLYGDQPLLIQEALAHIIQTARTHGYEDVHRYQVERGFDWSDFAEQISTRDLFAEKRVSVLVFLDKPDATAITFLQQLPTLFCDSCLFVLTGERLNQQQQRAKWFQALADQGVWVPSNHPEGVHFQRWMQQRFQQANVPVSADALQWMCQHFEGDLGGAASEIEKLRLVRTNQTLDIGLLQKYVTGSNQFSAFVWVEALLTGQQARACHILKTFQDSDADTHILVWALMKEMELLAQVVAHSSQPLATLCRQLKIWPTRGTHLQAAAARLTPEQHRVIWRVLEKVDSALAAFDKRSAWLHLRHLVIAFCQKNVRVIE